MLIGGIAAGPASAKGGDGALPQRELHRHQRLEAQGQAGRRPASRSSSRSTRTGSGRPGPGASPTTASRLLRQPREFAPSFSFTVELAHRQPGWRPPDPGRRRTTPPSGETCTGTVQLQPPEVTPQNSLDPAPFRVCAPRWCWHPKAQSWLHLPSGGDLVRYDGATVAGNQVFIVLVLRLACSDLGRRRWRALERLAICLGIGLSVSLVARGCPPYRDPAHPGMLRDGLVDDLLVNPNNGTESKLDPAAVRALPQVVAMSKASGIAGLADKDGRPDYSLSLSSARSPSSPVTPSRVCPSTVRRWFWVGCPTRRPWTRSWSTTAFAHLPPRPCGLDDQVALPPTRQKEKAERSNIPTGGHHP